MKGFTAYYLIKDLNIVGKKEGFIPYIYDKDKGWVVDNDNILSDRLIGFDETEEPDSPYRIGNTDMLSRVEEITEEQAMKLIQNM
jgi:hypothetical protein